MKLFTNSQNPGSLFGLRTGFFVGSHPAYWKPVLEEAQMGSNVLNIALSSSPSPSLSLHRLLH
jgi:hypothetical protein